jgi:signal transduction histidine kinase
MLTSVGNRAGAGRIAAGGTLVLAAALVLVGWLDFRATREHLLDVLRDQAVTVRHTVAAAARANRAAAERAEAELGARLLDNARLLAKLDRAQHLGPRELDEVASLNSLFRVSVYDSDGNRVLHATTGGRGEGQGVGMGRLVDQLLQDGKHETLTEVHRSRRGDARIAAGIRRAGGGVIVLNADASAIADLQRPYSLDALVQNIVETSHDLAFVVIEQGTTRITRGHLDEAGVMDVSSPVDLGSPEPATLRLGLRLHAVRAAERQTAIRLAISFSGLLLLAGFAMGFLFVRQQYGELTERHAQAQEALRRRERLAATGELAGTVAHEIRNPLNAIAMSAQRLRREFLPAVATCAQDRDDLVELITVLESESARLDARVQQFLEYARPPRLAPERIPIRALVSDVVASARSLAAGRGVSVEADVPDVTAVVDPAQFRQALDNVLRNAVEAAPDGSEVSVRGWHERGTISIRVCDHGAGIAAAEIPRIFDLYYTTKPHGTGIGLAVAHQVVAAHGGTIAVESTEGRGTSMTISIPQEGDTVG